MAILFNGKWIGFRAGSEQKITQGLFDKIKKKQNKLDETATNYVKRSFGMFNPPINYDNDPGKSTGLTKADTKAYSFWGKDKFVIRFKTPNNRPSRDGQLRGYAVFPLLGKSTSKKYGERNWLKKGAENTGKNLKTIFS